MDAIGKFEVRGELGAGASSTILKIRRLADGRIYALKIVKVVGAEDRKFVAQAQHEFEIGSQLDHPNIVKFYAFEKQTSWFTVTGARVLIEFVDGLPFTSCFNLPLPKLVSLFARTANALVALHDKDVFHADVKPDNLMATREGDVKLIDFGLAWRAGERKDRVQGTLEYLAPETASDKVVNASSEIFNLGATMFRMLTGKAVPPEVREAGVGVYKDPDKFVPRLSTLNPLVPDALDELVRDCVRFKPDDRPASMKAVRGRLKQIMQLLKDGPRSAPVRPTTTADRENQSV
ncbi:MAG: serine/threonine protein kinase [Planctomycetia bacterium]